MGVMGVRGGHHVANGATVQVIVEATVKANMWSPWKSQMKTTLRFTVKITVRASSSRAVRAYRSTSSV